MANSVYISTNGEGSGKSLISLGLYELLRKKYNKIASYCPISSDPTYCNSVMSKEEAYELISSGKYDELMERIISKYKMLEEGHQFVICEGTSFEGPLPVFELDLNLDIAKNLGAPVIMVGNGHDRNEKFLLAAYKLTEAIYRKKNVPILGHCFNHIDKKITSSLAHSLSQEKKNEQQFLLVIPEDGRAVDNREALIKLFNDNSDGNKIISTIENFKTTAMTYKMFEYNLLKMAKKSKMRIALPEGEDDRILKAAEVLVKQGAVEVTVLGDNKKIQDSVKRLGLNFSGVKLIDPNSDARLSDYAQTLYELRKEKGMTLEQAQKQILDPTFFATMMVYKKESDGVVSGASHSTADTIRPALQILKTRKGFSIVSSVFFMCMDNRVVLYGDCAVNPNPTPEQLAEIAISSADTAKAFDIPPRVAMLSYSSGDSGIGPDVEMVKAATKIVKERRPDLDVEGPLQYDAAVDYETARKKMPNSKVAGKATVFIFPDLNTGNNAYKAVQREAQAQAIGPMLQGLAKPVNDLSRGCFVMDVVNTALLTAIQAQNS
ncbi:MAG: phosphate acetyltransferase [Bdellovibrionales bacterium RIFOXYD12_FULL_39_22]|nr:MAG: phosphate acetyltransferase [Bdellovibrionales bacterium RIFOXYB1_FULL_39_21]OFZ41697.1 MAG: phosphate acetyltransferase [Bdellovibrionales bacterium RIFOXYC12_FULL_39_17]OFZ46097.1 MAG: phosphate acetyltransferase [Bdellovibrionales bacterium RIFOXYC1_FULL_39_130]OFZ74924.1 MAG: phosphate acetyltransferase [Bdellovibrionales bacterium RIFOXYD1_FULL_39_84]OFZ75156.1 MAG: phosphate acetyltransferase [Bdellovibrionales bacterium RIFOXYC2_FULL_39_8]OFZ92777.1 MAG: phosphate acetyltransfer